jgi:hypothetical protein
MLTGLVVPFGTIIDEGFNGLEQIVLEETVKNPGNGLGIDVGCDHGVQRKGCDFVLVHELERVEERGRGFGWRVEIRRIERGLIDKGRSCRSNKRVGRRGFLGVD